MEHPARKVSPSSTSSSPKPSSSETISPPWSPSSPPPPPSSPPSSPSPSASRLSSSRGATTTTTTTTTTAAATPPMSSLSSPSSPPSSSPSSSPPATRTEHPSSSPPATRTEHPSPSPPGTTTTAEMSSTEPQPTTTAASNPIETTTTATRTITEPPTTAITTTTSTAEPSVTPTTERTTTTTSEEHSTVSIGPVTTTKLTTRPETSTTKGPTITPSTTQQSTQARATTTTPYTTQYVTTVSIVTITTVVPRTTVISGRGTTIYITETTMAATPTVIPDPNQPPPPGTLVDPNNGAGNGLKTWQLTLIIVACLVVTIAVSAACFIGSVKKQRRHREMKQQREGSSLYVGDESIMGGSEVAESGGGKSIRTLIGNGGYGQGEGQGQGQGQGRWSSMMFRFRRPWDALGAYHGSGHHPSAAAAVTARPGGLWLMDEDHHNSGHGHHEAIGYDGSVAAAAMYPVSYQNDASRLREEGMYVATGQPTMAEMQDQFLNPNRATVAASAVAAAAAAAIGNNTRPISPSPATPSSHASPMPTNQNSATSTASSPCLLQPLLEGRFSESTDYADGQGYGWQQQRQSQEQQTSSQRESQDGSMMSGGQTRTDASGGLGLGLIGEGDDRRTIVVNPDQLEANALFEHFRKDPQALPLTGATVESPALVRKEREGEDEGQAREATAAVTVASNDDNDVAGSQPAEKDPAAARVDGLGITTNANLISRETSLSAKSVKGKTNASSL